MLDTIIEFRKGILFVRLIGELTKNTVSILENEVIDLIETNGIRNVVFNIENLEYIDLRGINYLLYTYEVCKNNHGRSLLCGINSEVKDKIKTSRLLNYMIETKDELSALKIMNI